MENKLHGICEVCGISDVDLYPTLDGFLALGCAKCTGNGKWTRLGRRLARLWRRLTRLWRWATGGSW